MVSSSSEAHSSSSTAKSSSSAEGKSSSSCTGKKCTETLSEIARNPQFTLSAVGREIRVAYAPVGAAYAVFDMQGRIIARGRVHSQNFGLTLSQAGGYLVSIGDQVQKVFIR